MKSSRLFKTDPQVYKLIKAEEKRQQTQLSMIPSENFFSPSVREAVGSVFIHKYAEGNVGKRYYEGNVYVDELETLALNRVRKVFKLPKDWDANVQALAGSNANTAVYLAVLKPGDTMMGMFLPDGGHLSHGWSYDKAKSTSPSDRVYLGGDQKVNLSSKLYKVVQYKTDTKTNLLDYDEIEQIAQKYKPQLIITGGTAYMREIDYKRMKEIAKKVGALYMADIAHEAGLIAGGAMKSPIGIADIVTCTTHKTLKSGRGAIIMGHKDIISKVNRAVLPGLQGGPFNNNIAGIAVGLGEAMTPEFKKYAKQTVKNAKALAKELLKYNFTLITGGTDKHMVLVNLSNKGVFGKYTAKALDVANIVLNMNTMPGETRTPSDPSAIRMGTPLLTARGMKEPEMKKIAKFINDVVEEIKQWADLDFDHFMLKVKKSKKIKEVANSVAKLTKRFPLDI